MINLSCARLGRLSATTLLLALTGACSSLHPTASPPSLYSLDGTPGETRTPRAAAPLLQTGATLIVNPPHAASGFDSQRIIYMRTAHQLEYYAHSEWVDTPARMLAPLIIAAVGKGGMLRAVIPTPSAAAGDLRLDTEIVRLQHDLGSQPSRVRFTLRAYVADNTTRRVLAWHEFDQSVAAASEDPYGSVVAANRAVNTVLDQLASFCNEAAAAWRLTASKIGD
ncbi:MAG: ABC-type transport auxiliary lipoprotein family protein [Proteobacteria bacterium]|nr:ABC-type transport auxiliary lipoprotein family protein [Pseudomonadota bacterium]